MDGLKIGRHRARHGFGDGRAGLFDVLGQVGGAEREVGPRRSLKALSVLLTSEVPRCRLSLDQKRILSLLWGIQRLRDLRPGR